jgi:hypothetical protein
MREKSLLARGAVVPKHAEGKQKGKQGENVCAHGGSNIGNPEKEAIVRKRHQFRPQSLANEMFIRLTASLGERLGWNAIEDVSSGPRCAMKWPARRFWRRIATAWQTTMSGGASVLESGQHADLLREIRANHPTRKDAVDKIKARLKCASCTAHNIVSKAVQTGLIMVEGRILKNPPMAA